MAGWFKRGYRPQSVLIHAKDHRIGDAFLQVPFFRSARARFPDARITLAVSLGGTPYATSLRSIISGFIDEVLENAHLCDDRRQILARERPLGGRYFDLVIDMQKTWWRTLAIRRIRHGRFISASKHYLFSSRRPPRPWKPPHLLGQFLKLLDAAGGEEVMPQAAVPWFGEAERRTAALCIADGAPAVGFVPGAGEPFKRWPLERFCAVARLQIRQGRRAVFVLGPEERDWIDAIQSSVPQALLPGWRGTGARGDALHPLEVAALGERLAAVVSNDCGTAHMLAAGAVPMIALFGATNPAKYAPATPVLHVLQRANRGADAIKAISIEDVADRLDALLAS